MKCKQLATIILLLLFSTYISADHLTWIDRAGIVYDQGNYGEFCFWAEKSKSKPPVILDKLADVYLKGLGGVYTNAPKAVGFLKESVSYWDDEKTSKADKMAIVKSAERLGRCYFVGHGVDKDEQKAQEYFIKAADRGNPVAQMSLGEISQDKKEFDVAIIWYKKVLDNLQSDDAQKRLARKKIEILMNQKSPTSEVLQSATVKQDESSQSSKENCEVSYCSFTGVLRGGRVFVQSPSEVLRICLLGGEVGYDIACGEHKYNPAYQEANAPILLVGRIIGMGVGTACGGVLAVGDCMLGVTDMLSGGYLGERFYYNKESWNMTPGSWDRKWEW